MESPEEKKRRAAAGGEDKNQHDREEKRRRADAVLSALTMATPQILKAVAESRFLTTKELGRLFLLTSKELTASASGRDGEEEEAQQPLGGVWKCLCAHALGLDDAKRLLEGVKPLSAEECFRKFVDTGPERSVRPRALRYEPKDYSIVVTMREICGRSGDHHTRKPIFCEVIKGEDIPDFFEKGIADVRFEQPRWEATLDEGSDRRLNLKWDCSIGILRHPDHRVIQLARGCVSEQSIEPIMEHEKKGEEDEGTCLVRYNDSRTGVAPLSSAYGQGLFGLIECYSDCCLSVEMHPHYRYTTSTTGGTTKTVIQIHGFDLSFNIHFLENGYSVSESIKNRDDPTFAHLLEAMEANP